MNFARALIRELVDKRLWPIAIVLVVALVAVPVILSAGGDSATSGDAPLLAGAPADVGAAKVAAVELAGPPSVRSRPGQVRDPFRRKPETAATSSSDAPAAATGGTASPAAAAPGETSPATATDGIDTTKTIDVRFGKADNMRRMPRLRAGTALPAGQDAVVRYAGVVPGTQRARFVVGEGVHGKTAGDAKCYEKDGSCYALDMRAGDKQTFVVDGVTYEIEIVSVPQSGAGNAGNAGNADTADAKASSSYYRTTVRFGAGSSPAATRPLSRLTPLATPSNHALIYLGPSSKGALFLLGSGVAAVGEGECLDADCRIVALGRGESTLIAATSPDGGPTRTYTLEVAALQQVSASAAVAKTMRARVHPRGRDVLREMLDDPQAATAIASFTYDADTGMLAPGTSKVTKVTG